MDAAEEQMLTTPLPFAFLFLLFALPTHPTPKNSPIVILCARPCHSPHFVCARASRRVDSRHQMMSRRVLPFLLIAATAWIAVLLPSAGALCPSGTDVFADTSEFKPVLLDLSTGAQKTVYRRASTGAFYLPLPTSPPTTQTYTNANVVGLSNFATCTGSTTDIGWIYFYSAAKIVFPSASERAYLDMSDRYSSERCDGYGQTPWCNSFDDYPAGYASRGIGACGGGGKVARGSTDITGSGFSFVATAGNTWPFYGTSVDVSIDVVQYSAMGDCASGGIRANQLVYLNEKAAVAPPPFQSYPGAITPVPNLGATRYSWTCRPGFFGANVTITLLEDASWATPGGPVNCTQCAAGWLVPKLVDFSAPWSCVPSPPGYFSPLGAVDPIPCPPGSYSTGASAFCPLCEAGTFSRVANATSATTCLPCPPMSFSDTPGSTACVLCPANTVSAAGDVRCAAFPSPSPSPSPPPSPSPSPTSLRPACPMRLFGSSELVGLVLERISLPEESRCLEACCANATCLGYNFLAISAPGFPQCALLAANLTHIVPSTLFSSAVRAEVLAP
jgi:hypothetical protein